jgi:hypothetical protein
MAIIVRSGQSLFFAIVILQLILGRSWAKYDGNAAGLHAEPAPEYF